MALLPALDPTAMGWAQRSWYVGEHHASLFDRSGNIGPTVWIDGRIVGGWAQRRAARSLPACSRTSADAAGIARSRRGWPNGSAIRVTPRFRTPLERELSA